MLYPLSYEGLEVVYVVRMGQQHASYCCNVSNWILTPWLTPGLRMTEGEGY